MESRWMSECKLDLAAKLPQEEQLMFLQVAQQACSPDNIRHVVQLCHKHGVLCDLVVKEVEQLCVAAKHTDFQTLWDLGWPRRPLDWPGYQATSQDLLACLVVVAEPAKRDFVRAYASKLDQPDVVTINDMDVGPRQALYHDHLDMCMYYPSCIHIDRKSLAFYMVNKYGDIFIGEVNNMHTMHNTNINNINNLGELETPLDFKLLAKLPTCQPAVHCVNASKTFICVASNSHVGILALDDHKFELFETSCKPFKCECVGNSSLLALHQGNALLGMQIVFVDCSKQKVVATYQFHQFHPLDQQMPDVRYAVSEGILAVYTCTQRVGSLAMYGLDTMVADTVLPDIVNSDEKMILRPIKQGFELLNYWTKQPAVPPILFQSYMKADSANLAN